MWVDIWYDGPERRAFITFQYFVCLTTATIQLSLKDYSTGTECRSLCAPRYRLAGNIFNHIYGNFTS